MIQGLDRTTLLAFYRRHYVTETFTLVIVGAVDASTMLAVVRSSFAGIPRGGTARVPAAAPGTVRAQRRVEQRPGGQAYLSLAWLGPGSIMPTPQPSICSRRFSREPLRPAHPRAP